MLIRIACVWGYSLMLGCASNPTQCGYIPQMQGDQIVLIATQRECKSDG